MASTPTAAESQSRLPGVPTEQLRHLATFAAIALCGLLAAAREGSQWQVIFWRIVGTSTFLWALILFADELLGCLVACGIMRWARVHHKRFVWTIDSVCVRPCWNFWVPTGSSKIIVRKWTWHNPAGFREDAGSYILQIDRMTLNLRLGSIWTAVMHKQAIDIDLLVVQGLRFRIQRNELSALNLWEALNLPDNDVNVRAIMEKCKQHGGLREQKEPVAATTAASSSAAVLPASSVAAPKQPTPPPPYAKAQHKVSPLPAAASEATRKASRYWRPAWGPRERDNTQPQEWSERMENWASCFFPCCGRSKADVIVPEPVFRPSSNSGTPRAGGPHSWFRGEEPEGYVEHPIGDPRRRPRWGVPVRFNIQTIVILQLEMWMLDILMYDNHETLHEPDDARMELPSLVVFRDRLEADDERRAGSQDGIHGVYLGELVWILIAEALYKLVAKAPSSLLKHAILATGYTLEEMAVSVAARTVEHVVNAKHTVGAAAASIGQTMCELSEYVYYDATEGPRHEVCRLHVHLMMGRHMTLNKASVNVHAELQLLDSEWKPILEEPISSSSRLWTKSPDWYEHIVLGPVTSHDCHLHIQCFHTTESVVDSEKILIGEVLLAISTLQNLQSAESIDKAGDIVGWFPLTTESSSLKTKATGKCTGELKLGLRLEGDPALRHLLQEHDATPTRHEESSEQLLETSVELKEIQLPARRLERRRPSALSALCEIPAAHSPH